MRALLRVETEFACLVAFAGEMVVDRDGLGAVGSAAFAEDEGDG